MDIKLLINKVKSLGFSQGEYAIFGSATLAIRGLREAPNIDIIVTDKLWSDLLTKNTPDDEGFIRFGVVKISNWWFAPTTKPITQLIDESEKIESLPFVKLKEVLSYKKHLNREKDQRDVLLIKNYLSEPTNLGIETYKKFLDVYLESVEKKLGDKVVSMVLFGSICRSTAKGDSDIDIFTFYDDKKISRQDIHNQLIEIIIKLRKHLEYKSLAKQNTYPEIYPFLISKTNSEAILPVFLDVADHGIILKDPLSIAKKLIIKIKTSGYKRTVLPNGKWIWTNLI